MSLEVASAIHFIFTNFTWSVLIVLILLNRYIVRYMFCLFFVWQVLTHNSGPARRLISGARNWRQ